MNPLLLLIVLGALFVLMSVMVYNGLVTLRNRYKNAYSQIDVQLKRRYDLIPNLVETAKGYLAHEKGTLEAVIAARNAATTANSKVAMDPANAGSMKELIGAESVLRGALGKLMVLSEAYPDLKANTTMSQLSEELSSTENKVAFARQSYNDAVMQYNTAREKFPSNLIASVFSFQESPLFQVDTPAERAAPKVTF